MRRNSCPVKWYEDVDESTLTKYTTFYAKQQYSESERDDKEEKLALFNQTQEHASDPSNFFSFLSDPTTTISTHMDANNHEQQV